MERGHAGIRREILRARPLGRHVQSLQQPAPVLCQRRRPLLRRLGRRLHRRWPSAGRRRDRCRQAHARPDGDRRAGRPDHARRSRRRAAAAGCDAGPRPAGVRGLQRARAGDAGAVRRVAGPGRDPGRLRRGRAQAGPERRRIQQRPGLSGRDFPERSRRQLARLRDGLFPVPPNDGGPAGRGRLPQLQHRQGRSACAAARHPDRHGGAALSGHVPASTPARRRTRARNTCRSRS